jgi:hypothetical protein
MKPVTYVLWGFRLPDDREVQVVDTGTLAQVRAAQRERRNEGWTTQFLRHGAHPAGLIVKAKDAQRRAQLAEQETPDASVPR